MKYIWGIVALILLALFIYAHLAVKKDWKESREIFYNLKRGKIKKNRVYDLILISWFYYEKEGEDIKELIDLFKNTKLKFKGKLEYIQEYDENTDVDESAELDPNLDIDYTEEEYDDDEYDNEILTRQCIAIVSSGYKNFDASFDIIIKSDYNTLIKCNDVDITFEGILQINERGKLEFTNVSNIQIQDDIHENLEIIYFAKEV